MGSAAQGAGHRAAKSKSRGVLDAGKEKWDELRSSDSRSASRNRRRP
jgi:hypothetical protein